MGKSHSIKHNPIFSPKKSESTRKSRRRQRTRYRRGKKTHYKKDKNSSIFSLFSNMFKNTRKKNSFKTTSKLRRKRGGGCGCTKNTLY